MLAKGGAHARIERCNATVGDENMMMTKTTIALAAALFLAVGTAAQARSDSDRESRGFSFHTGPLGQPLGGQQGGSWWADQSRTYGLPKDVYIRHHRPVR
jgi:hypothetical protein